MSGTARSKSDFYETQAILACVEIMEASWTTCPI